MTSKNAQASPPGEEWPAAESAVVTPEAVPAVETQTASVPDDWGATPEGMQTRTVQVEIQIKQHTGTFDPETAKIMIYGESGTGKTRLASTFPDVLFANIDKGMSSVTEKVEEVEIENFKQLESLYAFLKSGDHDYKTVVIDTLNEMQRLAMHATVTDFPAIRRAYDDLPSMSDYGKMLHDMVELTRSFVALPMRVVLLAQVISRQFETDTLQPQLVGKNTAREIARKMDVIGYIYQTEQMDPTAKHKLAEVSFAASEYVTKDRSGRLPATLIDPTWGRISSFWK